jgi:hypothetical protein
MNKVSFTKITMLLLISGILSSCKSLFPSVEKAYVVPQTDTGYRFFGVSGLALSPDGQVLVLEDLTQIQLETGNGSDPFDNYKFPPSEIIHSGNLEWSPDGQYLATTYFNDDRVHPDANRYPIYIYDTGNQTVFKANELASGFQHWSPFNTGNYLASNLPAGNWSIFNLANAKAILLDKSIDFREEKELQATDRYLWSKELDIPVAVLSTLPIMDENGGRTEKRQAAIISFSNQVNYENPDYYAPIPTVPTNNVIDSIFDPTGTFILTLQLECQNDIQVQCSKDGFLSTIDPNNVSDSILTITNWRTGEQKELYRLSQIDAQHVVASRWGLAWSSDGSTIIIGIEGSTPVVLKLDYP